MAADEDFRRRLSAVRSIENAQSVKMAGVYRNGQVVSSLDDVSAWDNFDRYFKFYNISVDDPSPDRR